MDERALPLAEAEVLEGGEGEEVVFGVLGHRSTSRDCGRSQVAVRLQYTFAESVTMAKSTTVTVRLDPELKETVEGIFSELGLSVSQAINLFYRQVQLRRGLPFDVRLPNETTRRALRDAEERRDLASYASTAEMFEDLGIVQSLVSRTFPECAEPG
jgi:DNA-damage-inducible protein J